MLQGCKYALTPARNEPANAQVHVSHADCERDESAHHGTSRAPSPYKRLLGCHHEPRSSGRRLMSCRPGQGHVQLLCRRLCLADLCNWRTLIYGARSHIYANMHVCSPPGHIVDHWLGPVTGLVRLPGQVTSHHTQRYLGAPTADTLVLQSTNGLRYSHADQRRRLCKRYVTLRSVTLRYVTLRYASALPMSVSVSSQETCMNDICMNRDCIGASREKDINHYCIGASKESVSNSKPSEPTSVSTLTGRTGRRVASPPRESSVCETVEAGWVPWPRAGSDGLAIRAIASGTAAAAAAGAWLSRTPSAPGAPRVPSVGGWTGCDGT